MGSADKAKMQQLDQKRAWEADRDRLLKMQTEPETKLSDVSQVHAELLTEKTDRQQPEGNTDSESKIEYKVDPIFIKTFKTKEAENSTNGISGLAIADTDLFITTFWSKVIEVYELNDLSFKESWKLDCLTNPWDLAYCIENKCLYIMDEDKRKIIRVDRNGELKKMWPTRARCGCLSVAYDCNVLTVEGDKITEYKPDGEIVREITLLASAGLFHTRYTIKMTDGRYLMSHGEDDDQLHRVCVVDSSGDIRMSFGGLRGSTNGRLNLPIYLSFDPEGSIFVVDRDNNRVLLLSSDLKFKRVIIPRNREGMHRPERIAFDHVNGRLLVVHNEEGWKDCRVFVFKIT